MRTITPDKYKELVQAFREAPVSLSEAALISHVANTVGVDRRTAKKAWEHGLLAFGFNPVRQIIADDFTKLRAQLHEKKEVIENQAQAHESRVKVAEQRDAAEKQALDAKAQEAKAIGLARGSALRIQGALAMLADSALRAAHLLKKKLDKSLKEAEADDSILDEKALFELIKKTALLQSTSNSLTHEVMVMERLHLGEPESVIGVKNTTTHITHEEAVSRLEIAVDVLQRSNIKRDLEDTPTIEEEEPLIGRPLVLS